jgi:hypothetical protein
MRGARNNYALLITLIVPAEVFAQDMPISPAFNAAIINGPASMVWEQGKASGSRTGYVCGKAYESDYEKKQLLAREAAGLCGAGSQQGLSLRTMGQNLLASRARPAVAGIETLSFRASATVRQRNLAHFVAETGNVDHDSAVKMEQLFASTDVIGQIGAAIGPYGLRTDNVADAYAVYWISAWEAAHGIVGSSETRTRAQAVKAQAARAILGSSEMTSATDAQKQEFAEAMLVQATLISAQMDVAAGDPAQLRAVARAVRQGAKASGLDLDAMVLTENGFVPVRGSSLGDDLAPTPGGAGATAVAAADAPPPAPTTTEASTPPYVLMAAAGGAGLAGVFMLGKVMGKKS